MLYELIGVVRPGRLSEVKDIAKAAGSLVLSRKGVVRGVTNWGTFLLPRSIRKLQVQHYTGQYFVMRFDSSAATQHEVHRAMHLDPRLLRYSIIKLGSKLEDIKDVPGHVEWNQAESTARQEQQEFMR